MKPLFLPLTFALAMAVLPNQAGAEPDPKASASGSNAFGVDLYQQLKAADGNLFFSPYSISSALGMTYAGAGGDTATQMRAVLHLPEGEAAHAGNAALMDSLEGAQSEKLEMNIANALWPMTGYKLLDPFLKTTEDHYAADLTPVNFAKPVEATGVINRWVDEQTRGKIKDLVPPDAVDALTRLVLTNAIYFKGGWTKAFDEKKSRDLPFHLGDGTSPKVSMMYQKDSFRYGEADGIQILELPYLSGAPLDESTSERIEELEKLIQAKRSFMERARLTQEAYKKAIAEIRAWEAELRSLKGKAADRLSMAILLPEDREGLAELESKLSVENLDKWLGSTRNRKVHVTMPKFKLETQFGLSNTLAEMGMPDAFNDAKADFSGMSEEAGLYISSVIHKAFVEVNEEGTEAAAATAVVVGIRSAVPNPDPVFNADHPFVFLIRDQVTGGILFMGRLADPRG